MNIPGDKYWDRDVVTVADPDVIYNSGFDDGVEWAEAEFNHILDKLLAQTKGGWYSSVSGTIRNAVADIRNEMKGIGRL